MNILVQTFLITLISDQFHALRLDYEWEIAIHTPASVESYTTWL